MPASAKNPTGPLTAAAAELESELRRYEETMSELEKIRPTTDKTLQRARKALEQCAAHQTQLAVLLPAFAQAMQAVQARQQACMDQTAEEMQKIKTRFEERMALVERIGVLGQKAQSINERVNAVNSSGAQEANGDLLKTLEEVGSRAEAVIAEADIVQKAAEEAEWLDVARDADTLKQQLQSARNKVLVAQRSIASRAPS